MGRINIENEAIPEAVWDKWCVPITIETDLKSLIPGSIHDFWLKFVQRFNYLKKECNLPMHQAAKLISKFETMATKVWVGWCLEKLVSGKIHPPV